MRIDFMTPLPKDPNPAVILTVLRSWTKMAKANKKHEIKFLFALSTESEAQMRPLLAWLIAEKQTLPIPQELVEKLFPIVAEQWKISRFPEIAFYRNLLLEQARQDDPDAAVFLDSDVVPPEETPETLSWMEHSGHRSPAVAGIVKTYNNDWQEVLGFGQFRKPFFTGLDWAKELPRTVLTEVDFANTACLALPRTTFQDSDTKFLPVMFDETHYVSEDHAFCHRLRQNGYRILVDTRIKCRHLRETQEGLRWLTV